MVVVVGSEAEDAEAAVVRRVAGMLGAVTMCRAKCVQNLRLDVVYVDDGKVKEIAGHRKKTILEALLVYVII